MAETSASGTRWRAFLPVTGTVAQETTKAARPHLNKYQPYGIQAATFAIRTDAQNLVDKINSESLPALVKPLSRGAGSKVYFCVVIGGFKTSQEAELKLVEFKKKEISKPFRDAFVRSF